MTENTEHPKRLWVVDEDERKDTHFFVREVDVEPVHPDQPPKRWTSYHIVGQPEWDTVSLYSDAYPTKVEALERAISYAEDAIYEWKQKRDALDEQLGKAGDEAAQAEEEEQGE